MVGAVRGRSPEMRRLLATVERIAKTDAPVLLLGETGTGKEVSVDGLQAVREASPRAARAFETVDCGTLLQTLVAASCSVMKKGRLRGPIAASRGLRERTHGRTLFPR